MTEDKQNMTKGQLLDQLMAVVQELPLEQIAEVSDFARDLSAHSGAQQAVRGSADSILQGLNNFGPLQFESDELETLLAEIEAMRYLDMEEHD